MIAILIVEDEAVLRLTFQQFLEEEGYTVYSAASYDEAVTHLSEISPDVVVSDIVLGGKSGVDLLRYIHDHESSCPTIMITGDPGVETAAEAVRLGAFDYLAKPVTGPALKKVVKQALDHVELEKERDLYEAQMEEYRRDLDAIFNSVTAAIFMVDESSSLRQVNRIARGLLGESADHHGSEPVGNWFPDDMMAVADMLKSVLNTGDQIQGQRLELERDGRGIVYDLFAGPLSQEDDDTNRGALLVMRDVTRLTMLEQQLEDSKAYRHVVGKSPRMKEVFQLIEDLADTDTTVLIYGESGTGKEIVATAQHEASSRREGPFVKVNCAALSEDILESELFGHVKGAFTGAVGDRAGRFESAHGGTILLDEIGDISPRLQLRLLRVLQSGEFERVGDSSTMKADVRVIASTNQDLPEKIRNGEFRQDLYYRLNVVRIELPALRERREDIPLLLEHFCRYFNTAQKKEIHGVSPEAMEILMQYPWPGNVRELENCLERAFIVCHEPYIEPRHLPSELQAHAKRPRALLKNEGGGASSEPEEERILEALFSTDWNVAKSARKLGIARNTLYQKIRQYKLVRPNHDAE
jgi:two-component system, NtrC family, response regulator HydG